MEVWILISQFMGQDDEKYGMQKIRSISFIKMVLCHFKRETIENGVDFYDLKSCELLEKKIIF